MLSFYPALFGLIMSAWWVFGAKQNLRISRGYMICAGAISTLILLSCLWSISPHDAFEKALLISIAICLGGLSFSLASSIKLEGLSPYLKFFPLCMIAAALLCSFELYFDMPIHRMLQEPNKDFNSSVMNRGIIFYTLCFFPVLGITRLIPSGQSKKAIQIGLFASAFLMMALTQSQSAQMALILGLLIYTLFPYSKKPIYPILSGVIAAMILLTPLIVRLLFLYGINGFANLPFMSEGYAGHRLEIWDFVIRYAMDSPLYGFGLEATRYVPSFDHAYIIHEEPTVFHPHNFSVQVWMEFGAIGATLLCAMIAYILKQIENLKWASASIAMPLLITILSISATGYGIWQAWWIGSIMFSASLFMLVHRLNAKTKN